MFVLLPGRHIVIHAPRSRDEIALRLAQAIQPRTSWRTQLARAAVDRPDYAGSVAGARFRMSRRGRYAVMAPVVRGVIRDDPGGARLEADVLLLSAPQVVILGMFGLLVATGYALFGWYGAACFALVLLANALLYVTAYAGEAREAERWLRSRLDGGAL
jgi:hypothetical protein